MAELNVQFEQALHFLYLSEEIRRYASTVSTCARQAAEAAKDGDDARWEARAGECREYLDAIVALAEDLGESPQQLRWRKLGESPS